ncbi:MAG: PaaI family thioesterase [Candidatus Dormibacteraeota bacterium]|nr:PaaI family thioesterase [Candidatus Dormibacteraeota bacterium]
MIDPAWLNDRSEYQQNFVHGLRNGVGLHLQFELDGERIVTEWTPAEEHAGFPGFVHGGLIAAVLDDTMGRFAALYRRFLVTARMDVRFREAAPLGVTLRVEGWCTRHQRRALHAEGRVLTPEGTVVAESTGVYLPLTPALEQRMVAAWPGFAEYLGDVTSG